MVRTKDCSEMESGRLWINEIERDRFVVIRIKDSEELKATGRIVVTPSGVYTYCFKSSKSEHIGSSEGHLGKLFFPLGHDVKAFESFGWPPKDN